MDFLICLILLTKTKIGLFFNTIRWHTDSRAFTYAITVQPFHYSSFLFDTKRNGIGFYYYGRNGFDYVPDPINGLQGTNAEGVTIQTWRHLHQKQSIYLTLDSS